VPAPGYIKPDTFCTILTLQNAVIQGAAMCGETNVRVRATVNLTYGSWFGA